MCKLWIRFKRVASNGWVISHVCETGSRQLLFGSMSSTRPPHGPRKRWKDTIKTDLGAIGINHAAMDLHSKRERGMERSLQRECEPNCASSR